jgi:hypothetical protein
VAIQALTRDLERVEGCVAGLRGAEQRLAGALSVLEPQAGDLVSDDLVVKEMK